MCLTRRQCLALLAAGADLSEQWRRIAAETDGTVGAAALHLESGRRVSLNGRDRFPFASVCKLPIAIAVLSLVDEGKLSLNSELDVPPYDVVPGVSDVAEIWPRRKRFRLNELLEWMVARSDNTAVQTLFRISGGAPGMSARFRQWGIEGMRLDRSERQCNFDAAGVKRIPPESQWKPDTFVKLTAGISPSERLAAMRRFIADPRDTSTPEATVQLLEKAYRGQLLSTASTARLVAILEKTSTGKARIKGLLPPGTLVAHKTGTTFTVMGLTGATNDVGVISLPRGEGRIAIAVYVKASTRDQASRDAVIAKIARAAYDSLRPGA